MKIQTGLLISVVVPCYNIEKYVTDCIKSIIQQTYKTLDIILVDDGSTDKSGDICDHYSNIDSRITVVHQENKGLSGARNTGIKCAKGEYILFVDGDDLLYPETIEVLCKATNISDVDIVSGAYIKGSKRVPEKIDDENECEYIQGDGSYILDCILNSESNVTYSAWGKLFRRNLFKQYLFKEGIIYEDFELVPRLYLLAKKAAHVKRIIYYYFYRENSIMGSSQFRLREYYFDFAKKNIDCIQISECEEQRKIRLKAGIYKNVIEDYCNPINNNLLMQYTEASKRMKDFANNHADDIKHNYILSKKSKTAYAIVRISPKFFERSYILFIMCKRIIVRGKIKYEKDKRINRMII